MTDKQQITEDDRIEILANPNWIKYIKCKKCYMEYEIEIASNPCLKCGGHDFEQFDLILYPMSVEQNQKRLDGLKALEELPKWQDRYSKLLNMKAISGHDQENDMKIVRSSIQDTIQLLNQFKGHYEKYPNYVMRWDKVEEVLNSELLKRNTELIQENQKLKTEIKELKGVKNAMNLAVDFLDLKSKYKIVQQESKQAIEIVKRLEEKSKPENVFDIVNDELMPMTNKVQNQIEITNWVLDLLQSILKGVKN